MLQIPVYAVFFLCSISDIKYRRIPNNLLIAALIFLIALSLVDPQEFEFPWRNICSVACLWITLLFLLPRVSNWIGSGDVKLILLVIAISDNGMRWDLWLLVTSLVAIATFALIRQKSSIPLAPAISTGTAIATLLTAA